MGKPNNKEFAYIGFRTTDEVYERVRLAAEAEDRTVSQFMRAILAERFPPEDGPGSGISQPGMAGP